MVLRVALFARNILPGKKKACTIFLRVTDFPTPG